MDFFGHHGYLKHNSFTESITEQLSILELFNPLSANSHKIVKHTQTIRRIAWNYFCKKLNIQVLNVVRWAIWYHLYNLKNVKNTHGGLLILVNLQAVKLTLLHGCFLRF